MKDRRSIELSVGHEDAAAGLLMQRAEISTADGKGQDIQHLVIQSRSPPMVTLLLNKEESGDIRISGSKLHCIQRQNEAFRGR